MTTRLWFTSDTHFGHANIIRYCDRPFRSVGEMDDTLIANWNARVAPGDLVWHLGDFSFADPADYVPRLNGVIHLVFGNHDERWRQGLRELLPWTGEVRDLKHQGQRIWLSHYAHRVWPRSHRGAWHCYGHSHGELPDAGCSTDVGVDAWNYHPIAFDDLAARFDGRDSTDHHPQEAER